MTKETLNNILSLHKKWIKNEDEGERADLRRADLRGADLRYADLQHADLQGADLQHADLQGADLQHADLRHADLRGADMDFSCWPMWCGSLDVKTDKRIAAQLAYHFCRLDCDDPDYLAARNAILGFANQFHRVNECGKLKLREARENDQAADRGTGDV